MKNAIPKILALIILFCGMVAFLMGIGLIGEETKAEPVKESAKYWTPPNY
ncbi:MAG: hypothetical protein ACI9N9_000047 [Enterobacterales bacterium]|jgi:hypothetical protein